MKTIELTAFSLAQRFVGMKEVAGSLDNPQIMAMLRLDDSWPIHDEIPWPLYGDTEVLTTKGWLPFRHLVIQDGVKVMQVNADTGMASLSDYAIVTKEHKGKLYVFNRRGLTIACDPNHQFYAEWGNRGISEETVLTKRPVRTLNTKMCLPLVKNYQPPAKSQMTGQEIELLAAYLADGNRKSPGIAQFNVSREDKKERLQHMGPVGIYQRNKLYGKNLVPATNYTFSLPEKFDEWLDDGRRILNWKTALSWNQNQREIFIETFQFFDGYSRGLAGTITTTSTEMRDILEALLFLDHRRVSYTEEENEFDGVPTKKLFRVNFSNHHNSLTISRDHRTVEDYSGPLYCLVVPDGAFIARGGNMPFVSGNCSAFVNYICWLLRLPRSKSLAARSWLAIGEVIGLRDAQAGFDVVVLKRAGANQPGPEVLDAVGHVGFFAGAGDNPIELLSVRSSVQILGGNQGNGVSVSSFPIEQVLGIRRLY